MLHLIPLTFSFLAYAADPACVSQHDSIKDGFTKAYVAPVKLIFDRAFAQMPPAKREEVAKMRAKIADDERRLAAAVAADPKMTEILSHDRDEGRRAFEAMKALKSEQRRYKAEIADLEYKLNGTLSIYLNHHAAYLGAVEAEARKLGVTLKIDRRASDLKNVTASKTVTDGTTDLYLVTQSFWTRADEVQIEALTPNKTSLSLDAYADLHLAAHCRP